MIKPSYRHYSQTTVRVENSQGEISRELGKYGITMVQHTQTDTVFSIAFQVQVEELKRPLTVRIDIPYNRSLDQEDKFGWRDQRIKYRVLFYYLKSLLEAWDNGLKTFAEIFLPHIVLPGGRTVAQDLMPKYTMAIDSGSTEDIKLLPEWQPQFTFAIGAQAIKREISIGLLNTAWKSIYARSAGTTFWYSWKS